MICIIAALIFVIVVILLSNGMSENAENQPMTQQGTQEIVESTKSLQESTQPVQENASSNSGTEIVIYDQQELENTILVQTSYCSLKYPFALSDVILIEAQGQALVFSARMQSGTYPIYTIRFCEEGEMVVGTIRLPDESQEQPVSVVFHDAPQGLSQDDERTFFAAQDTFTEVWLSLGENENFTLAE